MEKLFRNPLHSGSLRNLNCPCGSGKKIKKCHGVSYGIHESEAKAINQMIINQNKAINEALNGQEKE